MKFLERFALIVYSYLVLLLSVILCLLVFNWLDFAVVTGMLKLAITNDVASKVTLSVSCIFILLSIKCIFFDSQTSEKIKESKGILLKNENGQLLITKETLDNMVKAAVSGFQSIKECTPKISVNDENEITVTVQIIVDENVIIKDLAANIQEKIKQEMKKSSDLDVKEVNVKIMNINKVAKNNNKE